MAVTMVYSSTKGRSVEALALVTGLLSVTVEEVGGCVEMVVWVKTDATLGTGVVPIDDSSVVVRPVSVVYSVNPKVYLVMSGLCVGSVLEVATGILEVVVSVETVVTLSVEVVAGVVNVVAFLVGGEMLVVATTRGVSRRVVATATCEVRTGVTRVVNFGVIVEGKVLEVSWTSADVWVVAVVDSTALSVSRETLVVSVTE